MTTAPYRASFLGCTELPAPLTAELAAELEPGERVLWSGLPRRGALIRRAVTELVMPLAFNGFVLALVAVCSHLGASLALSAVPLLALGLPLFQAPLGAWRAIRTTFYAVTDRRALVFDADAIVSIHRDDIVSVRVCERGGDTGDIVVAARASSRPGAVFFGVSQGRAVARMLERV